MVIRDGVAINVEDNNYNGISYGANTLRRKNTYMGMGFDFNTQWAISEGESFPYNINQCAPPSITSCTSGQYAKIFGTAGADGTVYVFEGSKMYEGTIIDGKWEVKLGELEEGAIVKVSADTEDLMASILVSAKAESSVMELSELATTLPETASNVDVRVKRTIKADEWSTLVLPFSMTETQVKEAFGEDVQLADFTAWTSEEDEDGNIVSISVDFESISEIEANHPCIIKTTADITEFTVDGVDIEAEDEPTVQVGKKKAERGYLIGTYVTGTVVPENDLFLSDNKFWYSTGLTRMKALRAYFEFADVLTSVEEGSEAKVRFRFENNNATAIQTLEATFAEDAVYSVSGVRMNSGKALPKGFYIVNGKKILVK
ncbi:MAG: hypothetical protein IJT97_07650 [Bacteroidaceae bacterium]|nr:hypothetical protein [Bacteroidaceae bacterium]